MNKNLDIKLILDTDPDPEVDDDDSWEEECHFCGVVISSHEFFYQITLSKDVIIEDGIDWELWDELVISCKKTECKRKISNFAITVDEEFEKFVPNVIGGIKLNPKLGYTDDTGEIESLDTVPIADEFICNRCRSVFKQIGEKFSTIAFISAIYQGSSLTIIDSIVLYTSCRKDFEETINWITKIFKLDSKKSFRLKNEYLENWNN